MTSHPVVHLGQAACGGGAAQVTFQPKFPKGYEPCPGNYLVAHVDSVAEWAAPAGWTVDGPVAWRELTAPEIPVQPIVFSFIRAGNAKIDFCLFRGGPIPINEGTSA